MKIEAIRLLPEDKLTQARVRDIRCDEVLMVHCANAAECRTAERVAYLARQNFERPDGLTYTINTSYADLTVKVSVVPANN